MSSIEINTLRKITLQNAMAHRQLVERYAHDENTPACVARGLLRLLGAAQ